MGRDHGGKGVGVGGWQRSSSEGTTRTTPSPFEQVASRGRQVCRLFAGTHNPKGAPEAKPVNAWHVVSIPLLTLKAGGGAGLGLGVVPVLLLPLAAPGATDVVMPVEDTVRRDTFAASPSLLRGLTRWVIKARPNDEFKCRHFSRCKHTASGRGGAGRGGEEDSS